MREMRPALFYGHNIHTGSWFYYFCFIITSIGALPYANHSKLSQLHALYSILPVTKTIIVHHLAAIFLVFKGVSLHISASESIGGYGCRAFRVA